MSVTFAVDDVVPAAASRADPPPGRRDRAGPGDRRVWLTIAQGVAQHVRLNAEALRPRLVRHAGRERLTVSVAALPTDAAGWADVVAGLRDRIAREVGDGRARLLECDFSTSTEVELVASRITLMDVYSPYFDCFLMCICGIPQVTLLGTPDDWRAIRRRVDVIAELDLAFWTPSLIRIADELVRTAEGKPDLTFWRGIYKPKAPYGGDRITGWIARLYPYLQAQGEARYRNPMLARPFDSLIDERITPSTVSSRRRRSSAGGSGHPGGTPSSRSIRRSGTPSS